MNTDEIIIEHLDEATRVYFKGHESYFQNTEITFSEAKRKTLTDERACIIEIAKMLQLEDHRMTDQQNEAQRI